MSNELIYKQLLNRIDFLYKLAKRKNWTVISAPLVDRPATIHEIQSVERQIGKTLPPDLKELFLFSKHVEFSYQFEETLSEEFKENFSGEIVWNLDSLTDQYFHFQEWLKASLDPAYNDADSIAITKQICQDKFPLMEVFNGDVIAVGKNPSEVIYFSHEGDIMHGKTLGQDLWSFLDLYLRIGFAGSEGWQLQPFYIFDQDIVEANNEKINRYVALLER